MDAPAVAVTSDGKKIATAWMGMPLDGQDRDVLWAIGTSGKFGPEAPVHGKAGGTQGHPALAFDGDGTAWCAWEDTREGPNAQRIHVIDSKSKKERAISAPDEGKCGYPTLAFGCGILAIAYETSAGIALKVVPR